MQVTDSKKTVIIVCGPTAVGKTDVAIELAKYFNTEIISADSRQCFKELNIGVARPSEEALKKVVHHFIASHSILEEMNAAIFEIYALNKVAKLFETKNQVVLVGGTGLYIKAFCEGLDTIPQIPISIREKINKDYFEKGMDWLQNEVMQKDSLFYKESENKNPHRLLRALEVVEATGKSILTFRKNKKFERDFEIIKIGLDLPKEILHQNIATRVDKMMEVGQLDEVKSLLGFKNCNALQTVGYSELVDFIENKISLTQSIEEIKKNTRRYAKRQLTWFRKDKEIFWFHPNQISDVLEFAAKNCN